MTAQEPNQLIDGVSTTHDLFLFGVDYVSKKGRRTYRIAAKSFENAVAAFQVLKAETDEPIRILGCTLVCTIDFIAQ